MIVQVDGVFYGDVISITQTALNKAALVMPDRCVIVPIYSPIQIIGDTVDTNSLSGEEQNLQRR